MDFRCTPTELYSNNSVESERLERGFKHKDKPHSLFRIFFFLFHSFSPFSAFIAAIFVCVCRPAAQWRQLGLQGGGRGCAVGRRPVRGEVEAEGEGENVYGHRANLISTGGDSS